MMRIGRFHIGSIFTALGIFAFICVFAAAGCETLEQVAEVGVSLASSSGVIDSGEADNLRQGLASGSRIGKAAIKAYEGFTPEQVHYLSRSVGAMILGRYSPYNNQKANEYVNLIGQTVALASEMPETYGGYRFLILDSSEINAFAAPGGHIFVTRGLLECCRSEDAVAAVLAHEIGHVQFGHGLKSINQSRRLELLKVVAAEAQKVGGSESTSEITSLFSGCISDIAGTLITKGYSREFEFEADKAALTILKRIGYEPAALSDILKVMGSRLDPSGTDFAKTHPSPEKRLSKIRRQTGPVSAKLDDSARRARFQKNLGKL